MTITSVYLKGPTYVRLYLVDFFFLKEEFVLIHPEEIG